MNFLKNLQKLVVGGDSSDNPSSNSSNPNLKPKKYTINQLHIQEEKLLSEGGYGYVWKAHNVENKKEIYAVKRMICQGKEKVELSHRELEMMYKLPQHENLVRFIDGEILKQDATTSQAIYVMEYCPDGTLFDLISAKSKTGGLSEPEILAITLQICKGLDVMHSINITHRDLKVENVLLKDGICKICDFGSASSEVVDLSKCDRKQLGQQEELYERFTTLQSRPPEMCDVYCREVINHKVDSWMLGCLVYCLCFQQHPFWNSSKTGIVCASFRFKPESFFSEKMHDFIRLLLTPTPSLRPSISEVIVLLSKWDKLPSITLNEQAQKIKQDEFDFQQNMMKKPDSQQPKKVAKNTTQSQVSSQKPKPFMPLPQLSEQKHSSEEWGDFQDAKLTLSSNCSNTTNQSSTKNESAEFAEFAFTSSSEKQTSGNGSSQVPQLTENQQEENEDDDIFASFKSQQDQQQFKCHNGSDFDFTAISFNQQTPSTEQSQSQQQSLS